MAIEDSNPSRRNLVVTSLAFVAYYYAGGYFKNHELTLEVVNLSFTDYWVLGFFAWGLLIWFAYRYWVEHRGELFAAFQSDVQNEIIAQEILLDYVRKIFAGPSSPDFRLAKIERNHARWSILCAFGKQVETTFQQHEVRIAGIVAEGDTRLGVA